MAAIVVKGYRPSKKADTPPPLYLTNLDTPPSYCHTCGRVVSTRRVKASAKFCSDKCKHHKPSIAPTSIDRHIQDVLYELLDQKPIDEAAKLVKDRHHTGDTPNSQPINDTRIYSSKKGEKRVIVPCSLVESIVFGRDANVSRGQGRRRERAKLVKAQNETSAPTDEDYDEAALIATLGKLGVNGTPAKQSRGDLGQSDDDRTASSDDSDLTEDEDEGVRLDPSPEVTGSVAHHACMDNRRQEGQKRAQQREQVRNACRRAVVFGLLTPGVLESTTAGADDHAKLRDDDSDDDSFGKKGKRKSGRKAKDQDVSAKDKSRPDGRRLCEAMMRGDIVEPSFAKGEWGVRWRE